MLGTAFWLFKQLTSGYELNPISAVESQRLQSVARRLEKLAADQIDMKPSMLLARAGHRRRLALMMVEPTNNEFIYGFPRPMRPNKEPFMKLLGQPSPFGVKTATGVFHGPADIQVDQITYKLFVGRVYPPGFMHRFNREYPGLLLICAMLVSGLLCALLAWSLLRSIRQLQRAANRMSTGDLTARVGSASERGDEIGQLGKDFNHMSEQVEKLLNSQKRLLADISHELRSPLARLQVAIGIAQQQDEQGDLNPATKQLERIEKEAQQIEQMLEQLLKLSRLEAQQQAPHSEPIELTQLLGELVENAQFEAQGMNKEVEISMCEEAKIEGDPALLASAFENVIRNAVKYCSTKVQVFVCQQSASIVVEVKDDGPGVPEAKLAEIFVPFYRLSESRTRLSGGVGLGLAISQQAIRFHQGTIEAQNQPEGGLQICISLPRSPVISSS